MVWLADQNTTYGISGPMPIVLMSLVKSIFNTFSQIKFKRIFNYYDYCLISAGLIYTLLH